MGRRQGKEAFIVMVIRKRIINQGGIFFRYRNCSWRWSQQIHLEEEINPALLGSFSGGSHKKTHLRSLLHVSEGIFWKPRLLLSVSCFGNEILGLYCASPDLIHKPCFPPLSLLNRAGKNINGNPWNGTCLWWSRSSMCAFNSGRGLNPTRGLFGLSAQPAPQQKKAWRPHFSDLLSPIQFSIPFRTLAQLQRENI